ncbi:MAG TPA: gamma-glutamyl-gamma-aminobutyrate hydrolase family protein [Solirubrobacterales bacterium]|nr:gamma-glutamyl-gamma-aminobutyrate hydrolase family protein [Solirubrobacterales bacterium]
MREIRSPVRVGIVLDPRAASFGAWRDIDVNLLWAGYVEGIDAAGGLPVTFPPTNALADNPEAALGSIDALLLNGGPDIQASSYGEDPHPQSEAGSELRDQAELALARAALAADMPILGICRGMQILNIAMGGGIDQHIHDPDAAHRSDDFVSHRIQACDGSLLARAIGSNEVAVRSFHHQGIDPVADGMDVVAKSPDGLVEAVEAPGQSFCLAVLWHPEQDLGHGGQGLFDALVQATRERAGALV